MENHIVGAPCGVMDQMTSACGEADKLLAMVCQVDNLKEFAAVVLIAFRRMNNVRTFLFIVQPAEVLGLVEIPGHIQFWGIDSGIRHR